MFIFSVFYFWVIVYMGVIGEKEKRVSLLRDKKYFK